MTTLPLSFPSYRNYTGGSPSVRYSPSILNSSGRDSESVSSPVSSVQTTNELGRCKTSSDASSPVPILNEDEPKSSSRAPFIPGVNGMGTQSSDSRGHSKPIYDSSRVPFLPSVSGQGTQGKDSWVHSKPTSYIDRVAPPRRRGANPEPSQSFPTNLPIGPAQDDATPVSDAALISSFCHACELFIQGERAEVFEILIHHRCVKPTGSGYAHSPEYPNYSHSRQEQYSQTHSTHSMPGVKIRPALAPPSRGHASSYYDGHPQTFLYFKQLMLDTSGTSHRDTYAGHRQRFEQQSDASDPNVSGRAIQDINRYPHRTFRHYTDNQSPTPSWPRQTFDDPSSTNMVVEFQPGTPATMSSAHPFQQYDEWQLPVSQDRALLGQTSTLAPYEYVARPPQDPGLIAIASTDSDW